MSIIWPTLKSKLSMELLLYKDWKFLLHRSYLLFSLSKCFHTEIVLLHYLHYFQLTKTFDRLLNWPPACLTCNVLRWTPSFVWTSDSKIDTVTYAHTHTHSEVKEEYLSKVLDKDIRKKNASSLLRKRKGIRKAYCA